MSETGVNLEQNLVPRLCALHTAVIMAAWSLLPSLATWVLAVMKIKYWVLLQNN